MSKLATFAVALGALVLAFVALSPSSAEAGWRRGGHWGWGGPGANVYVGPRWGWYGPRYRYRYWGPYAWGYPYAYYPYWRGYYWRGWY